MIDPGTSSIDELSANSSYSADILRMNEIWSYTWDTTQVTPTNNSTIYLPSSKLDRLVTYSKDVVETPIYFLTYDDATPGHLPRCWSLDIDHRSDPETLPLKTEMTFEVLYELQQVVCPHIPQDPEPIAPYQRT